MKNNFLKIILISILSLFLSISNLLSQVSVPATTSIQILSKIASATNFTSDNNNNMSFSQLSTSTSTMLNISDLKDQVEEDAIAFELKVDEKALEYLTTSKSDRSMSEAFFTTSDVEDSRTIPDVTPDTYIYDTGIQTLTQDSNYADAGIFSDTAGAQQGQMKVYVDFNKKIMWTEIISHMTLTGKSQVTNNPTLEVEGLSSFPVVSDNYYFVKDDGTAYFPGFDEGRDIAIENSGTSIRNTDDNSLNFDNAIEGNASELAIDRRVLNHNTTDGAISHDSSTASWGGTVIFGDFGLVTAGANSENTISFEAANCRASCSDTDYAQSVERYTVTVTGVTASKAK